MRFGSHFLHCPSHGFVGTTVAHTLSRKETETQEMIFDLALERHARDRENRAQGFSAWIQSLLDLGSSHPAHLAQILAEGLSGTLPDGDPYQDGRALILAARALGRGSEGNGPGPEVLLPAFEAWLEEVLLAWDPKFGPLLKRLGRLLFTPPKVLDAHLLRVQRRQAQVLLERQAGLFQALGSYLAHLSWRWPGRTRVLDHLTEGALGLLAQATRLEDASAWFHPAARVLATLAQQRAELPPADPLAARVDQVMQEALPCLGQIALELQKSGQRQRFLDFLPLLKRVDPTLVRAFTRGDKGALGLDPSAPPEDPAREFSPETEAALQEHRRRRGRLRRLRRGLRGFSRGHLAELLKLGSGARLSPLAAAALYPSGPNLPIPVLALYVPRGAFLDRPPELEGVEVQFEKRNLSYRVRLVFSESPYLLSALGFLDEASSMPFRRSLTYSEGRYQLALVELETLEILATREVTGYLDFTGNFHRGVEAYGQGQFPEAIKHLERALAANPRLQGVHARIGQCFARLARSRRDLLRARTHFEKEVGLNPSHAAAWYQMGLLDLREGQWQRARESLDRCLVAAPGFLPGLVHRLRMELELPAEERSLARTEDLLRELHARIPRNEEWRRLLSLARSRVELTPERIFEGALRGPGSD